MKIKINDVEYELTPTQELEATDSLRFLALEEYNKLDTKWRLMAKPVAREILRKMEDQIRAKHGNEAALQIRPAKHEDACTHLLYILSLLLQEALNNVTISVDTLDYTVSNFSLSIKSQGQAGGQVGTDGNERMRENNGAEVS